MRTRAILALTAAAGLAGVANAQQQSVTTSSTINVTLSAAEAPGGNGNGVIEPGESALISMNVAFTNQNTVGTFSPNIGTFGSGTIRGFGSGWFDINGSGGTTGSWDVDPNNGNGPQGIWDIAGAWGTNSGNNLTNIQLGQFPPNANAINTANPIAPIWQGVFTPSSYSTRTVTFNLAADPAAGAFVASIAFKLSSTLAASAFVDGAHLTLGSVQIGIAPAPSSLALLGLGGLVAGRRRRR